MSRTLAAVAETLEISLIGEDASFGPISIDSRSLDVGALFVAIEGAHFDGNDFVADAHSRGAAGALALGGNVQIGRWSSAVSTPHTNGWLH